MHTPTPTPTNPRHELLQQLGPDFIHSDIVGPKIAILDALSRLENSDLVLHSTLASRVDRYQSRPTNVFTLKSGFWLCAKKKRLAEDTRHLRRYSVPRVLNSLQSHFRSVAPEAGRARRLSADRLCLASEVHHERQLLDLRNNIVGLENPSISRHYVNRRRDSITDEAPSTLPLEGWNTLCKPTVVRPQPPQTPRLKLPRLCLYNSTIGSLISYARRYIATWSSYAPASVWSGQNIVRPSTPLFAHYLFGEPSAPAGDQNLLNKAISSQTSSHPPVQSLGRGAAQSCIYFQSKD